MDELSATALIRETDDGLLVRKIVDLQGRKTIDADEGIEEVWISTEAIDRDGDIVEAAGADLSNYLRNPVVLFGHNYWSSETVVARTLKLETEKSKGIRAQFQFAPDGVSRGADTVRGLWQSGLLNAASIGFMVSGWNWIDADGNDLEQNEPGRPDGAVGRRFAEWELLEWSIVPVPANQEALRAAVGKMAPAGATWLKDALESEPPGTIEGLSVKEYESALEAMFGGEERVMQGEQISGKAQYQDVDGKWHDLVMPPASSIKDGELVIPVELDISEGTDPPPDNDELTEGEEEELVAAFATLGEAVGTLTDHFAQRS